MLVLKLLAFENKKYTSYDHFYGKGLYSKVPTEKKNNQNARIYHKTTLQYNKRYYDKYFKSKLKL